MGWHRKVRLGVLSLAMLAAAVSATNAVALETKGLWVQFEERGSASGYWPGQVIQQFNQYDPIVGHNVSGEVSLQLDAMHAMGVNTLTIELRTADTNGNFSFPTCNIDPALGFQWPHPTATELANIVPFFDLAYSKGFKIILVLVNSHMEEQPRTNSQTWLGAILNAVKNHPALNLVVFNGTPRRIDANGDGVPDSCGIPAEAPLWLGPGSVPAGYAGWAITYAMSLGLPASKLSVGTIVGNYFTDSEPPAGPDATDGHLWKPIGVMKSIFDGLGIPTDQRRYALSFYEHRKCATAGGLQCTEVSAPGWADQTLQDVFSVIGTNGGARVVAYEMGNMTPVDPNWPTSSALANLVTLLSRYNAEGGSFWRWTSFENSEDSDPTLAQPIKLRGTAFNYTPAKAALESAFNPILRNSVHDVDHDGKSDILWRNSDGEIAIWFMDGATATTPIDLGRVDIAWQIAGTSSPVQSTGDFDGDGKADILWRNNGGGLGVWLMNGTAPKAQISLGTLDPAWQIVGVGDFDGDGKADILWRHSGGALGVWLMNGTTPKAEVGLGTVDAAWRVVGVGDFDGDGKADILWRHTGGDVAIWEMNGTAPRTEIDIGNVPTAWQIVSAGDVNGDGKADILWRHIGGDVAIWEMNGTTPSTERDIGNVPPAWQIVSTGDYDGDGKSDLLWRNSSGALGMWLMNGTTPRSETGLGSVDPAWTVVE